METTNTDSKYSTAPYSNSSAFRISSIASSNINSISNANVNTNASNTADSNGIMTDFNTMKGGKGGKGAIKGAGKKKKKKDAGDAPVFLKSKFIILCQYIFSLLLEA